MHMMCLTDFLPDTDMQFYVGWSFVSLIVLFLVVNLAFVLSVSVKQLRLLILKYYRRCAHSLKKKFGMKDDSPDT
jgi:hypothetical protein